MKILVSERTIELCKAFLGADVRNTVCVKERKLVITSTYESEETLVCNVMTKFLYENYYCKGIFGYSTEMLCNLFGVNGFKLLRNNYAIEYAGKINNHDMWML